MGIAVCHGKELSYYTLCEQDETVSCNHKCPLSTLLLHLHSNCLGTHVCFARSSSNKLPNFISATNFKIMLRWDEFTRSLHARISVRYACSFVLIYHYIYYFIIRHEVQVNHLMVHSSQASDY